VPANVHTLGKLLRGLSDREGWTLKQMSEKSGIPVSTLSKVEHDRLTLTYDKLQQLAQRLGMRMSELFAEDEAARLRRSPHAAAWARSSAPCASRPRTTTTTTCAPSCAGNA
jgi:transcriptional regulator with XRE-family HTH domain